MTWIRIWDVRRLLTHISDIQLEWLSASTKLVREAIARWASLVEGYGLKLMQVPLHEACKFREHHPFDQPQPIKLAIMPPTKNIVQTPVMGPYSPSPQSVVEDPVAYHKAILRKLNFVLDTEAARSFTTELDVRYTWGPPSYEYTQFVHKSGLVLAEITCAPFGDDSVNFKIIYEMCHSVSCVCRKKNHCILRTNPRGCKIARSIKIRMNNWAAFPQLLTN